MKRLLGCGLMLLAACRAGADEPPTTDLTRSPGDLSVEERTEMMRGANGYSTCVYHAAMERLDASDDIRQVADLALGACQSELDRLAVTIRDWGFAEQFASGFTRSVRDRATRRLLPELAIRKSR